MDVKNFLNSLSPFEKQELFVALHGINNLEVCDSGIEDLWIEDEAEEEEEEQPYVLSEEIRVKLDTVVDILIDIGIESFTPAMMDNSSVKDLPGNYFVSDDYGIDGIILGSVYEDSNGEVYDLAQAALRYLFDNLF